MLYLVVYDFAKENNEYYAVDYHVVYATCNKELAEKKKKELAVTKRSADIFEFPFESDCDEEAFSYYE